MARPTKTGLDYFPLDVNFLNDLKTKKLVRSYGAPAVAVALNVYINIYRDNGYFVECDDDVIFLIADELKLDEEYTKNVIKKMIEVDFFDKSLYENHKILTSVGIQNRYLLASGRRVRSKINAVYDLINTPKKEFMSTETEFMYTETTENEGLCQQKYTKEKKRKEKKVKESKPDKELVTGGSSNNNDEQELIEIYQANFGVANSIVQLELKEKLGVYGKEMILESFKRSIGAKNPFLYMRGIWDKWKKYGITTLEQVQASDERHEKNKPTNYKKGGYVEIVPDWVK